MEMLVFVKAGTLIYSPDSSMCLGPSLSRLLAYLTNTTDSPSATRVPLFSRSIPTRSVPNLFHAQVHHIYFLSYRCILLCNVKKDMTVGLDLIQIAFVSFVFVYIFSIKVLPSIYHPCAGQGWAAEHAKVVGPRGGRAVVTRRFALRRRKPILRCWRLQTAWWVQVIVDSYIIMPHMQDFSHQHVKIVAKNTWWQYNAEICLPGDWSHFGHESLRQ